MLKLEKEQNEIAVKMVLDAMVTMDRIIKRGSSSTTQIEAATAMARLAQSFELKPSLLFADNGISFEGM